MKCRPSILVFALASVVAASVLVVNHNQRPARTSVGSLSPQQSERLVTESAAPTGPVGTTLSAAPIEAPEGGLSLTPELRALAEQDPVASAGRLAEVPRELRAEFAALIASAWGKTSPEAAAAWAREQLDGEARAQALLSLSSDWAMANPAAAAQCGLTDLQGAQQQGYLNTVGMRWGQTNLSAALGWGAQLGSGAARDSFLAGVACAVAENSPREAAELVRTMGAGHWQDDTAVTVIIEWSRKEPEAAAEWVQMFPESHLREQALRSLVSVLAEDSPASDSAPSALMNWPQGPERDQAIRYYLDEVLETRAALGAKVLPAISDQALRQEEAQRVEQYWLAQAPDAAREWAAQAFSSEN